MGYRDKGLVLLLDYVSRCVSPSCVLFTLIFFFFVVLTPHEAPPCHHYKTNELFSLVYLFVDS